MYVTTLVIVTQLWIFFSVFQILFSIYIEVWKFLLSYFQVHWFFFFFLAVFNLLMSHPKTFFISVKVLFIPIIFFSFLVFPSLCLHYPSVLACFLFFFPLLLLSRFSHVRLCATPYMAVYQAPLSLGFSRQERWSGLPFPSPGDLPKPEIKPRSPALQVDSLLAEPPGKPKNTGW